jgi:hypothetical protein
VPSGQSRPAAASVGAPASQVSLGGIALVEVLLPFLVGQRPRELVAGDLDELVEVERPDRRGARSTLLCVVKVLPALLADQ